MRRLLIVFLFLSSFASAYSWEADYSKAVEASRVDQKPLLLFFTGSDWSGLSMKMKNESLDSDAFKERIISNFHCVEVDFPLHKPFATAVRKQNEALKSRFSVQEYPLLVLLDSNQREIMRFGYFPQTGEQLVRELLHVVSQDSELTAGLKVLPKEEEALCRLYQLAQVLSRCDAEEKILSTGVTLDIPFFQLEQYRLFVEEGGDATALREKLLKSEDYQVHFTVAMIDFQERASTMSDPLEVIKPLEAYLERFADKDEQNVWRIEMMLAQFYLDADEWGEALKHAETAYQTAPKTFQGEIKNSLQYIQGQLR